MGWVEHPAFAATFLAVTADAAEETVDSRRYPTLAIKRDGTHGSRENLELAL